MPTTCGPTSTATWVSHMRTASSMPGAWMAIESWRGAPSLPISSALPETRAAFGSAFTIWVDRIEEGRFADTNQMFVPPEQHDVRVIAEGSPRHWAERIVARLRPTFDPQRPTALFVGRYQPFHEGHRHLVEEGIR